MTTTNLEQIDSLYKISEYMGDAELTDALEVVAKIILRRDVPMNVVAPELVRLQAIGVKLALMATWKVNVDKTEREKKNIYYTAADQIDKLVQSMKYLTRG